jgi:hypothetical protein
MALASQVAQVLQSRPGPNPVTGTLPIQLGGVPIEVPKALLREDAHVAGSRVERLALIAAIADFAPLPPPDPQRIDDPLPDRVTLVLSAARGTKPDRLTHIYSRFLTGEARKVEGGLIRRLFRAESPFADRALYLGVGASRFIALCPVDPGDHGEPCVTDLSFEGIRVELRFDQDYLGDWERLMAKTAALISRLKPTPRAG